MGSNRNGHRLSVAPPRAQAGITALGFLVLASLVGVVGLAAMKVTPMYIKNMRVSTVLDDMERDLSGQGMTVNAIRTELSKRISIEDIRLEPEQVKIAQSKNGYSLRVQFENRAPYLADVYLVVAFDKQVEIRR